MSEKPSASAADEFVRVRGAESGSVLERGPIDPVARLLDMEASTQMARRAGRINAAAVPAAERDALLAERRTLLDKKLAGEITKQEDSRLQYVRWSLDRIEAAKQGGSFDRLEAGIERFHELAEELDDLYQHLNRLAPTPRKRR